MEFYEYQSDPSKKVFFFQLVSNFTIKRTFIFPVFILVLCSVSSAVFAQDFETYFADKSGYTIDLPSNWGTGMNESRGPNAIMSFDPLELHAICIVMPVKTGMYELPILARDYRKIVVKRAKKKKDEAFEMGEIESGKINNVNIRKYTYKRMMLLDNGETVLVKYTDYFFKKKRKTFRLIIGGEAAKYEDKVAIYNKIAQSFKYTE